MKTLLITIIIVIFSGIVFFVFTRYFKQDQRVDDQALIRAHEDSTESMILAGGCFWCVEADMEKVPGVVAAISGYSGGGTTDPTYGNYAGGGHREVVKVVYDPAAVTYRQLVTYFMKHIDPTDPDGQFVDRGVQYSPAIYYQTEEEKQVAEEIVQDIVSQGVLEEQVTIPILPRQKFWKAEAYHQDYYKNHAIKYRYYRSGSGRNDFIEAHWGNQAAVLPPRQNDQASTTSQPAPWNEFSKPSDQELRRQLSDIQYRVTQEDGTERAFENEYWDTTKDGIYVDIVSGEPLFSSRNKFTSGTGWPSFTKPLEPGNIITREDQGFLFTRTEVRSAHADSHLGHVFEDGPQAALELSGVGDAHTPEDYTGLRYCMNSAALRFIPKERLKEEGYGQYLTLFDE